MPSRGHKPHELYQIPKVDVLEIISGNCRIIYKIKPKIVYIIAILDGRQDVKAHLIKRIMHPL